MKEIVAIFLIISIHGNYGTIYIKEPSLPVVEGNVVTLTCMSTDPDVDMSQFHLARRSRFNNYWYSVPYSWCLVARGQRVNTLTMKVDYYSGGTYICLSNNSTKPDNSTQPLTLKVHFLKEPYIHRQGGIRYPSTLNNLEVQQGGDVLLQCSSSSSADPKYFWKKEGEDWILPSSKLALKNVRPYDGGIYTCTAEHPTLTLLMKSHSLSITVLPEDSYWYDSINGRIILMMSAAGAALLALMLTMAAFLIRRAKKTKGPIDDHSQKKPIYKGSTESLPASTSGDTQPLV